MKKYVTPEILTSVLSTDDVITTSGNSLLEGTDGATNYGKLNRYINGR